MRVELARFQSVTRVSYTTWAIEGPKGRVLVRRVGRSYLVGHAHRPLIPSFFTRKFSTKYQAVLLALTMVGKP